MLLPRAFAFADVDFSGTIFGWGSGGEGNVAKITALLSDLGFSRIAVDMDNNVPATVEVIRNAHPDYLVSEIPALGIRDNSATSFSGVEGLLDASGKQLRDDLKKKRSRSFRLSPSTWQKKGQRRTPCPQGINSGRPGDRLDSR